VQDLLELGLLLHKSLEEVMALSRLEVAMWIAHLQQKHEAQQIEQQKTAMLARLKNRK
jgi:hypothetical protein